MNKELYLLTNEYKIVKVNICTCKRCKERGELEIYLEYQADFVNKEPYYCSKLDFDILINEDNFIFCGTLDEIQKYISLSIKSDENKKTLLQQIDNTFADFLKGSEISEQENEERRK